jgi:hypothetical protein
VAPDPAAAPGTGPLARDVYWVVGEDRQLNPVARGVRWVGTVAAGLLDIGDAPALSDIVIRLVSDDSEVGRVHQGSLVDFEGSMRALASDLETLTPEAFAETWLRH